MNLTLELADAKVLGVGLDDPQGVGVTHAALPALNNDNSVVLGQDVELLSPRHGPLDTAVDILLPVNLGEVGLFFGEVEGIHATVQVSIPGGAGVPGHHEDGAHGTVLGEQTSGLARGGKDDDTTGVQIERRTHGRHGARLDDADGTLDLGAQLLEVGDVWDRVLGLEACCDGLLASTPST